MGVEVDTNKFDLGYLGKLGKFGQSKFMPSSPSPTLGSAFNLGSNNAPDWGGTWGATAPNVPDVATPNWFEATPKAINGPLKDKAPDMGGTWMDGTKTILDVAKVGMGIYSALDQSKMNKFMRGYYGDQMALQTADFANNAKSTNASLEQRAQNKLSAQGFSFDSAENKAGTADYMKQWGVKETV